MTERYINAEHLALSLVARKANPRCRWAAMSNSRWSPECRRRYSDSPMPEINFTPILAPMQRGYLHRAIQSQRLTLGLPSIRQTFGVGLRALLAEPAHFVPANRSTS